jgi:hypothetical protein
MDTWGWTTSHGHTVALAGQIRSPRCSISAKTGQITSNSLGHNLNEQNQTIWIVDLDPAAGDALISPSGSVHFLIIVFINRD